MQDSEIVELYWARSENAIAETGTKYGTFLHGIAFNILDSNEDSEECVNDTYLRTWNSVPPHKPVKLGAYLAVITRNLAITVFRSRNTASRAGSQYALSLDELAECVSGGETPELQAESGMITRTINDYLRSLSSDARVIFVCRYFYNDPISRIAGYFGASETKIKSSLFRTRKGLKKYLEEKGIDV